MRSLYTRSEEGNEQKEEDEKMVEDVNPAKTSRKWKAGTAAPIETPLR